VGKELRGSGIKLSSLADSMRIYDDNHGCASVAKEMNKERKRLSNIGCCQNVWDL
jgi:hypothetical protein